MGQEVGPKVGFAVVVNRKPTCGPTFHLFLEFPRDLLLSYFWVNLFWGISGLVAYVRPSRILCNLPNFTAKMAQYI